MDKWLIGWRCGGEVVEGAGEVVEGAGEVVEGAGKVVKGAGVVEGLGRGLRSSYRVGAGNCLRGLGRWG